MPLLTGMYACGNRQATTGQLHPVAGQSLNETNTGPARMDDEACGDATAVVVVPGDGPDGSSATGGPYEKSEG
jgi:hypothetical protein